MDKEYSYEEDYKSNIEVKANEILKATNWQVRSHNKMNIGCITDSANNPKKLERLEYEAIEESKYFLNKAICIIRHSRKNTFTTSKP